MQSKSNSYSSRWQDGYRGPDLSIHPGVTGRALPEASEADTGEADAVDEAPAIAQHKPKQRPFFTECRGVATAKTADKLALMLLASYAKVWPDGAVVVSVSQTRLLAESGMSEKTWRRSLARLEALGAVQRRRRYAKATGIRLTTEYALTPGQAPGVVYPEKTWAPMAPESPPTQNDRVDVSPPTQNRPSPPTQNRPSPPGHFDPPLDVLSETSYKDVSRKNQKTRERKNASAFSARASEKHPPQKTEQRSAATEPRRATKRIATRTWDQTLALLQVTAGRVQANYHENLWEAYRDTMEPGMPERLAAQIKAGEGVPRGHTHAMQDEAVLFVGKTGALAYKHVSRALRVRLGSVGPSDGWRRCAL